MTKTTIAGGAAALILAVFAIAAGYWALEQDASPAAAPAPVSSDDDIPIAAAPDLLHGRITTYDGDTYEGRLRWGGDEEAFWGDYFNGVKDENPWAAYTPLGRLAEERRSIKVLGLEIPWGEPQVDLSRPFMARFGDIARIEARGDGVRGMIEDGVRFDPDVRVTLKSGAVFDLDRLSAGDFDDGVRVWDDRRGVVDLGPHQIHTVEFLPADGGGVSDRLFGTVRTRQGSFTGSLQWDREGALGHDELVGRTDDGLLRLRFDAIRSIARHARGGSLVTLLDGREVVLSGTRAVGPGHRGIYVDDPRYGRLLVSWDAFERVDFSPGDSGPDYGDFPAGRPLTGRVTTRDGRHLAGRLVYDLDESETTETLDAPSGGVDYTIPFGQIASIALLEGEGTAAGHATVTLQSGESLELERTGDLGAGNAGLLIFPDGQERPDYVPWSEVVRVDLDRPPAMSPSVSRRERTKTRPL